MSIKLKPMPVFESSAAVKLDADGIERQFQILAKLRPGLELRVIVVRRSGLVEHVPTVEARTIHDPNGDRIRSLTLVGSSDDPDCRVLLTYIKGASPSFVVSQRGLTPAELGQLIEGSARELRSARLWYWRWTAFCGWLYSGWRLRALMVLWLGFVAWFVFRHFFPALHGQDAQGARPSQSAATPKPDVLPPSGGWWATPYIVGGIIALVLLRLEGWLLPTVEFILGEDGKRRHENRVRWQFVVLTSILLPIVVKLLSAL